jgi:hypothetical protein
MTENIQWLKISPVGRNDKKTTDVMFVAFLSCTEKFATQ